MGACSICRGEEKCIKDFVGGESGWKEATWKIYCR